MLLVLDPGVHRPTGHNWNLLRAIAGEMNRRERPYRAYVHAQCPPEMLRGLSAHPYFTVEPNLLDSDDPMALVLENFLLKNDRLLGDLRGLPERLSAEGLTIVLPTVAYTQLHAVARWLKSVPPKVRVVLMMFLSSGVIVHPDRVDYDSQTAPYYRVGFNALRESGHPNVVVSAPRGPAVAQYEFLARRPVQPFPFPTPPEPLAAERAEPPLLLFPGDVREGKGFALLPDIVTALAAERPQVRLAVQLHGVVPPLLHPVLARLEELERRGCVILLKGFLDGPAYTGLFLRADAVVMPYHPGMYAAATSGVLAEAMHFGRPVVVPAGTILETELARLGSPGVAFAAHEADSIAQAMVTLVDNLDYLSARASIASRLWRGENGTARLVDFLLGA